MAESDKTTHQSRQGDDRLRVVTYNIHSCVNRRGQASPDTILAAIEPLRPDVVALQEVMHMTLELPAGRLHIFNTHMSLFALERRLQMRHLTGNQWLGSLDAHEPVVFCGDLNAGPRSAVYRRLARRLTDVQSLCPPPKATYSSRRPVFRIDHLFVSDHFKAAAVRVPRNETVRRASDHLPLCAELLFDSRQPQG